MLFMNIMFNLNENVLDTFWKQLENIMLWLQKHELTTLYFICIFDLELA